MTTEGFPTHGEIAQAVDTLDSLRKLPPSSWAEVHYTNLQHALGIVMPVLRARRDRAQEELERKPGRRKRRRQRRPAPERDNDPGIGEEIVERMERLADMVNGVRGDLGELHDEVQTNSRDLTDVVERVGDLEGAA